jgi:hypothetical protein
MSLTKHNSHWLLLLLLLLSFRRAARYMDAAAHGGQVVTDAELLNKVMSVWAAQDKDDSADNTADSNVQELLPPVEASPREHPLHEQQQQQQQEPQHRPAEETPAQQQQCASPASVSGSEVGQLPVWFQAKRFSQLASPAAAAAGSDNDPQGLLVPAQRSRSETYIARQVTFSLPPHPQRLTNLQQQQQQQQRPGLQLRGGNCSSSFTYGARPRVLAALGGSTSSAAAAADLRTSPMQALLLSQGSLPNASRGAATLTDLPEAGLTITLPDGVAAAQCEPVHAMHLGTFLFKGSGEFRMVHVLHASLVKRQFPIEPPKGKGQRLVTESSRVEGLQDVTLQIPQCLLAARRMFLLGA